MELKPYQHRVIKDLEHFLSYVQKEPTPAKAFNQYWEDKLGMPYTPQLDGSFTGMKPYKDNVPNAVHIAIKVPTAGGKTFIACNAIHTINRHFNQGNTKAVVWLVPWSNLLQQTVDNLSNPNHPYREKLNSLFGNRVEVYEKDQLLQGANFNPTSVTEQLNIFVFNFSSLRINSRKKDDRKVFQENGALESFRNIIVDKELVLPDTDETALINIIRSLNPIVIVDESHNAESDLSVEMLNNLNPSLVLDLTATPKENSNIISFVNALALKKENMVKLPVVVYNHHKKEEVITSALHLQRQLELLAIEEEKLTGKYIRPIILFQAQSNIKGKDNTTFQKIKDQLVKLQIPEEQIKIKTSGIDELKGIDLMSKNCPVKYIITINALKEGWDCPNAYILASLADKSSAVEVEQILGRVLRQPYVVKHKEALLNMSFVLTASSKFNETLDSIVKGLQESGFSKDDYYAEEAPEEELTPNEILTQNLFSEEPKPDSYIHSDEDFDVNEVAFNPNDEVTLETISQQNTLVSQITERAKVEGQTFEQKVNDLEIDDTTSIFTDIMKTAPKVYKLDTQFKDLVPNIKLPQFFKKVEDDELGEISLFEELNSEDQYLNKVSLLDGFKLSNYSTQVSFDELSKQITAVDFDENKKTATVKSFSKIAKRMLTDTILAKPKASQINQISSIIVNKLGDMTPISQQELQKYVSRIFDNLSSEQIRDIVDNDFIYVKKIRDKINELTNTYAKERFKVLIDSNKIIVKENFTFPESLSFLNPSTTIGKSLYDREASMNNFEQNMIMDVSSLENIEFWHRNLERGKGFALNGFSSNHYPDFILYTKKGNIILLETKGDVFDNDDSRNKNILGKTWAEKAGDDFKYFMVFETKDVENTYTARSVIEVIRGL
ncbi:MULTISPECIES: DEAD/DEAH box helicase [Bizionia]|uniref:Restriction endonuclease n=1 Tax=Bizionia algoritergicola TaxID=291187 RepID=A0A5D0R0S6_9FLAO|nr:MULTISPECIES: DEAD/DEAH box helicase family protein [Bizionia]OBX24222.1 restriction endonuclease [Bizionia sp. APA-3]TYB75143.1 restriction endonuclease [Bizionia algoritergicola]